MINQMKETMQIISGLGAGIAEYFTVKIFPSIILPVFGFFFGFQSQSIMLGLLALIVMDFVTGIFSAKVSGEPIHSKSAIRSAYKVAIYGLLVSAGHITEEIVPLTTFIEEAITTFLALTEMISIIENIGKMGYAIPKKLLNRLNEWRDEGSQTKHHGSK